MTAMLLCLLVQDPLRLIERLSSDDMDARVDATAALARLGDTALVPLLAALDSTDAEVAARAHDLICNVAMAIPDDVVRRHRRLQEIRTRCEISSLIARLELESFVVYEASPTMRARDPSLSYGRLLELGGAAIRPILDVALDRSLPPDPRIVAVRLLGKASDSRAVDSLVGLLSCRATGNSPIGESVGDAASLALDQFPDFALMRSLIDALHASNDREPIGRYLNRRTGRDFGADAAAWNAWWEARVRNGAATCAPSLNAGR